MGQAFGCYQVDQSNVAIKEHFGKFSDVLEPGCHCLPWCLGYQIAGGLSLRVQQLDVRCETKTKVSGCFVHYHEIVRYINNDNLYLMDINNNFPTKFIFVFLITSYKSSRENILLLVFIDLCHV